MYKIWNKLFGWEYIQWENTAASGISRLRILPDGTVVYRRYSTIQKFTVLSKNDNVLWLTCLKEKYFPEKSEPLNQFTLFNGTEFVGFEVLNGFWNTLEYYDKNWNKVYIPIHYTHKFSA